jgi:hypothetical protein
MTSLTLRPSARPLQRIIQADGLYCLVLGTVLALVHQDVSLRTGLDPAVLLLILGIGTALWGIGIFGWSTYRQWDTAFPRLVIGANIAWVVLSLLLLIADPFGLTDTGRFHIIWVGAIVGLLIVMQIITLRRAASA